MTPTPLYLYPTFWRNWIEILSNLLGWVLGLGADAVFIQFLDHNGHSISHLLSHINPTFVEMLHVKNKLLKWKEGKRRLRKSGSTFSSPGFLKRPRSFFCNPHGFNSTFPTVNFRFVLSLTILEYWNFAPQKNRLPRPVPRKASLAAQRGKADSIDTPFHYAFFTEPPLKTGSM